MFSYSIVRMRERGVLSRIRKKWISQPASACFSGNGVPFKTITFSQVESAFRAFVITIFFICPVLFIVEKIVSHIKSRRFNKSSKIRVSQLSTNNIDLIAYYNWKF